MADPIGAINERISSLEEGYKLYRGRVEGIGKELKVLLAELNIITGWIHEKFGIELINKKSCIYKHIHDYEEVEEISEALSLLASRGGFPIGDPNGPHCGGSISGHMNIHYNQQQRSQSAAPSPHHNDSIRNEHHQQNYISSPPPATPPPTPTGVRIRVSSVPPPSLPPCPPIFQASSSGLPSPIQLHQHPTKALLHGHHNSMSTPSSPASINHSMPSPPPPPSPIQSQLIISKKSKPPPLSVQQGSLVLISKQSPLLPVHSVYQHQHQQQQEQIQQQHHHHHQLQQHHQTSNSSSVLSPVPISVTVVPAPILTPIHPPPLPLVIHAPNFHSMPPKKYMSKKNAYQINQQQQQQQQQSQSEGNIKRYFKPVVIVEQTKQQQEEQNQRNLEEQRQQEEEKHQQAAIQLAQLHDHIPLTGQIETITGSGGSNCSQNQNEGQEMVINFENRGMEIDVEVGENIQKIVVAKPRTRARKKLDFGSSGKNNKQGGQGDGELKIDERRRENDRTRSPIDRDYCADNEDEGCSSDSTPISISSKKDKSLKISTPVASKQRSTSVNSNSKSPVDNESLITSKNTSGAEDSGKPEKLPKRGRPKKKPEERVRTYDPRVPMMCDECGKVLKGSGALRVHKQIHANVRPHECKECGKAFRRKHHLEFHMMIHAGDKKETCSFCGKAFLIRRDLARHERTHTGEKPYGCTICPKSFNVKQHLTLHIRTHTGERPYKCAVCEKTFTQANSLRIHKKIHARDANNAAINAANNPNGANPSSSVNNTNGKKVSVRSSVKHNLNASSTTSGISSASTSAIETPENQRARAPSRSNSIISETSPSQTHQEQTGVQMIRIIQSPPPSEFIHHHNNNQNIVTSSSRGQFDMLPSVGETVTVVTSPLPAHQQQGQSSPGTIHQYHYNSGGGPGNILIHPNGNVNNSMPTWRLALNPGSGTTLLHSRSPPPHSQSSPMPAHSNNSSNSVIRPPHNNRNSGSTLIRAFIPSPESHQHNSNNSSSSRGPSSPQGSQQQQQQQQHHQSASFTIYDPNIPNVTRFY